MTAIEVRGPLNEIYSCAARSSSKKPLVITADFHGCGYFIVIRKSRQAVLWRWRLADARADLKLLLASDLDFAVDIGPEYVDEWADLKSRIEEITTAK